MIRKICSITGQLLRICILRKRNIQVLVEFDSIDTARRIKNELDGVCFIKSILFIESILPFQADIYSGCCTLKIEFANVSKNLQNDFIELFPIVKTPGCPW